MGRAARVRPSSARTGHPCRSVGAPAHPAADAPAVRWRHDAARYAELIAECQAAIVRGDAYQLCLTNRIDVDVQADPASTLPRVARLEPEPSRRIPAIRRRGAAERVARAVPARRARRRGLDEADEGHPASQRRPCDRPRPARRAAREREGTRREPDDRRPHAKRPGPHRRARQRERTEPARGRGVRARAPAGLDGAGPHRLRLDRARRRAGGVPRRLDDGRAQAQRDVDPARARAGAARRVLRGVRATWASTAAPTSRWSSARSCSRPRARASAPAGASPRSPTADEEIEETRVKARALLAVLGADSSSEE